MGIPLDNDLFNCRYPDDIWNLCDKIIHAINNLAIKTDAGFNNVDARINSIIADIDGNYPTYEEVVNYVFDQFTDYNDYVVNTYATLNSLSSKADDVVFTGATNNNAGTKGLVPAPTAGRNGCFLRGDGNWTTVDVGSITADSGQSNLEDYIYEVGDDKYIPNSGNKTIAGYTKFGNGSNLYTEILNTGDISMNNSSLLIDGGDVDLSLASSVIVPTPSSNNEAASKKYVDDRGCYYGTCSTLASTINKVVTCSGFVLHTGAIIAIKFTNTNSKTAKLDVNSTGGKNIWYKTATAHDTNNPMAWPAGATLLFVYDGTYYRYLCSDIDFA